MSSDGETDDLVMAVLVGASLVGFVLGIVFLAEPRSVDRYTQLYFVTHKVPLVPLQGLVDLNYSGIIVEGGVFGHDFLILGPGTAEEALVFRENPENLIKIYQTFKLGDTFLFFAGATERECLFHEYSREVMEFTGGRVRFVIENNMKKDRTYYYKTFLGGRVVDQGEAFIRADERKEVVSSFPVDTTNNQWTRIWITLDTGQNISFGFRTYR